MGRRSLTSDDLGVSPSRFFVTTFALSWVVWVPLMLIRIGALPPVVSMSALTPLALLGVLMPGVAAVALTRRAGGRAAQAALLARLRRWRLGRWWLVILLVQPAILAMTAVLVNAADRGDSVEPAAGLTVGGVLASIVFLSIAAVGEEVGWRGLALPAIQDRLGPVRASAALAAVTATWHLPYWVLLGVLEDFGVGYLVIDYVFIAALTFQVTWLFNQTGGSVFAAVCFHVVFNAVNVTILPVTGVTSAFVVLTVAECLVSLAVLGHLQPRRVPSQAKGFGLRPT